MEKIDKYQTASFDVDAQRGFTPLCPDELPVLDGHNIVEELNKQAEFSCLRVGSKDWHPRNALWIASKNNMQFSPIFDSPNMDMYWNAHCIAGTEGAKLLPGLPKPEAYSFMVYKGLEPDMHPYGACYHNLAETQSTGVIEFLQSNGIKTVIVGGLATDYCVKTTVMQLMKNKFDVIINLGGCRGIAKDTTEKAFRILWSYSWENDVKLTFIDSYIDLAEAD